MRTTANNVNNGNNVNKKEKALASLAAKLDVDVVLIDRFLKHRREIKKPASDKAVSLAMKDFRDCVAQGLFTDLNAVMDKLDNTTWQTVKAKYLEDSNNARTNKTSSGSFDAASHIAEQASRHAQ